MAISNSYTNQLKIDIEDSFIEAFLESIPSGLEIGFDIKKTEHLQLLAQKITDSFTDYVNTVKYNSGIVSVSAESTLTLNHGLGYTPIATLEIRENNGEHVFIRQISSQNIQIRNEHSGNNVDVRVLCW